MVGHRAELSEIRDPTCLRTHAGHRRRLDTSAGRSRVGVVVARDPAVRAAAAGRHSGHHQSGKTTAGHRENPRSHGAEAVDCRGCSFRTNDNVVEHLQGRSSDHGNCDVGRSTIVESNDTTLDSLTDVVLWPGEIGPQIFLYFTMKDDSIAKDSNIEY